MVEESFVTYLLDVNGEYSLDVNRELSFVTYLLDVNGERILCDIFIRC